MMKSLGSHDSSSMLFVISGASIDAFKIVYEDICSISSYSKMPFFGKKI
jgi:hypothetical protein